MIALLWKFRASRAVSTAVAARRKGRWLDAAAGYEAASRFRPDIARFHIQAGHMRKEGGDYDAAERHYEAAARVLPDDAELALQFGHFYNVTGRLIEADAAYRRAARLRPGWEEPRRMLERIETVTMGLRRAVGTVASDGHVLTPADVFRRSMEQRLLPEYLSTDGQRPLPAQGVRIRRLGRFDRSAWATARTLQGIEAIMAHCITADAVDEVRILLNGRPVHCLVPDAHAIEGETGSPLTKFAFNLWLDLSAYVPGRYHLEIIFCALGDTPEATMARSFQDYITILPPDTAPILPGSEVWVPPVDPDDSRSLDEQINARPSIVRHAPSRTIEPPSAILVLRTDQLGDLSISVPALRRLRELVPAARIIGLLTAANADLAQTLDLFDEVIVADFPDIPAERQRVMSVAEQERLGTLLRAYRFDAAIDLSPSHVSRNLLLLAGAKLTMGFGRGHAPWLGAAFDFDVQDVRGQTSILPSPAKTLALIEAFGTLFMPVVPDEPATTDPTPLLAALGVAAGERFVVLHDGARIAFSRWPAYPAFAEALIARYDVKVVLLTDQTDLAAELSEPLRANPRFVLLDRRLSFAELDALVCGCALFVGNDTGPKHLAALRGAPVVSIHSARANWGEWGQAGCGAIITRQVPCAACHIYNDAEECTRDFVCVTAITVDEVIAVAADYL
jgi:ADP-heptose:LPS heptosyltransferase/tetratricopeptide (TPR) repeat protein